ncbi:MAG: LamG domain-containing protein, partial [bacterium]|nr:LamG domain-containing protein [bacterium]
FAPRRLWLVEGTNITRIPLARTPNWNVSDPNDVKSQWWTWTEIGAGRTNIDGAACYYAIDTSHLTQPASYYQDAIVWTEYSVVMATPYAARVRGFNADQRALHFVGLWGDSHIPWQHNRYFLEDKPQFLDSAGEFWFEKTGAGGRLYLRLPADQDPNGLQVEAARQMNILDSDGASHLHISGLAFRFNNAYWDLTARYFADPDIINAAVRIEGTAENVAVRNCRFEQVSKAVRIKLTSDAQYAKTIAITDNDIISTDHGAIEVGDSSRGGKIYPPFGPLGQTDILRNHLCEIGIRPYPADCHGHAIIVGFPETAEIAGNILERCYGSGLFIWGGKGSGELRERQLTRILIHHNRVTDPLLNCNDWGGIETWQGGPFYLFSNISGNPGGYWNSSHVWAINKPASQRTHTTARFGFAFYLDGSFKNYLFNNVVWGLNNNLTSALCNASAFQHVLSFENTLFNNTIYKIGCGIQRHAECTGRNAYLGNLWMDLSAWIYDIYNFDVNDAQYDYANLAFSRNLFYMVPRAFGILEPSMTSYADFASFQTKLVARKTQSSDLGKTTASAPVRDAAAHDFRPAAGSAAIDYGVRAFTPWGLYRVCGEWQFRYATNNPALLRDEQWYMTSYYTNREMYYTTYRFDMTGVNLGAGDFVPGELDDYCPSAVRLNGSNQYAMLTSRERPDIGLNIGTNNFLIEVYFRTQAGHTNGVLVAKADTDGYLLDVDELGRPRFTLRAGGADVFRRRGSMTINDGAWHHLISEFARSGQMNIYVDGIRCNGLFTGSMPAPAVAITTTAQFTVGKGPAGSYFAGDIDYLRVARGTLTDAKTTIDELYTWQFAGPSLRDFRGRFAIGRHDAGAFEDVPETNTAPRVLVAPRNVAAEIGYPAGLRVFAENALGYQWRQNGMPLGGATNPTWTVNNAQPTHDGDYDVVISNALGVTTSASVTFSVVPEPAALVLPLPLLLCSLTRKGFRR